MGIDNADSINGGSERIDFGTDCELYERGMNALVQGEYHEAIKMFEELLQDPPLEFNQGVIELRLGTCCHHLGSESREFLDRAVKYLLQAYDVIDRCNRRFDFMRILDLLGSTYWQIGNYAEAAKYMEEGLEYLSEYSDSDDESIRRDGIDFLFVLGDAHLYLDRYKDSLDMYERARPLVSQLPNNECYSAELQSRVGRTLHYKGEYAAAGAVLGSLDASFLTRQFRPVHHFTLLRNAIGLEEYDDAIRHFERLKEVGIAAYHLPYAHHFAGLAYYCLRRFEEATHEFQESMKYDGPEWITERSKEYLSRIAKHMTR